MTKCEHKNCAYGVYSGWHCQDCDTRHVEPWVPFADPLDAKNEQIELDAIGRMLDERRGAA